MKWISLIFSMFCAISAEADTTYYTMLDTKGLNRRECNMEGGQIWNGNYYGAGGQCRRGIPYTTKYCPWGIGNHDNCIVPCVHGVGPRRMNGKRISIRPMNCPWGPLKGQRITSIIVADSGPGHIDVFTGVCLRKKHDNCVEYAPDGTMASYGRGRGHETQIAQALIDHYAPGAIARYIGDPEEVPPVATILPEQDNSGAAR
jgi:hypothetical protein